MFPDWPVERWVGVWIIFVAAVLILAAITG